MFHSGSDNKTKRGEAHFYCTSYNLHLKPCKCTHIFFLLIVAKAKQEKPTSREAIFKASLNKNKNTRRWEGGTKVQKTKQIQNRSDFRLDLKALLEDRPRHFVPMVHNRVNNEHQSTS